MRNGCSNLLKCSKLHGNTIYKVKAMHTVLIILSVNMTTFILLNFFRHTFFYFKYFSEIDPQSSWRRLNALVLMLAALCPILCQEDFKLLHHCWTFLKVWAHDRVPLHVFPFRYSFTELPVCLGSLSCWSDIFQMVLHGGSNSNCTFLHS